MKYDLSAVELLKGLGYDQPAGRGWVERVKQQLALDLPEVYCTFMELAAGCPVLGTSNLWTGQMTHGVCTPDTLYHLLQEEIEARKGAWKSPLGAYEKLLQTLFQRPEEEWPQVLPNYLLIGSDYGGGAARFGIRVEDLREADPPVYWHRDGTALSQWKVEHKALSEFLNHVLVEALACVDYSTAEDALEEKGWRYEEYFDVEADDWVASKAVLKERGVSFAKLKKYKSSSDGRVFCCFDETKDAFYVGSIDEGEISLSAINRDGAERIFVDIDGLDA